MDRAERRYRQKKKWISRLKKLWNSHVLWNYISPIKQKKPRTIKSIYENHAESWQNFTKDRFGVLVKNTGTVMTDNKRFDIKILNHIHVSNIYINPKITNIIITYIMEIT